MAQLLMGWECRGKWGGRQQRTAVFFAWRFGGVINWGEVLYFCLMKEHADAGWIV